MKYFEVSAEWMKATGHGDAPAVFPVIEEKTNMVGGQGFDCFLTLDVSGHPGMYGKTWVCAVARGKFVPAPVTTDIIDAIPEGFFVCESCGEVVDVQYRVFVEEDGISWPICRGCCNDDM